MGTKISWILIIGTFFTCTSGLSQSRQRRSTDLKAPQPLISDAKLPKKISPSWYQIDLKPILEEGTFEGTIRMNLTWNEDSRKIFLHAHNDLFIDQHEIILRKFNLDEESEENDFDKPKEVKVQSAYRIQERNMLVIYLKKALEKGTQCELKITFSGVIGESPEGLFKGNYSEPDGEEKYYLATYMRENNARRLFPCFDEPEYKVRYTVSISRPKQYTTLFNTPIIDREELKSNCVIDHFETTPPMSSFSFGFVISQLPEVPMNSTDETGPLVIKMWARSGNSTSLEKIFNRAISDHKYLTQYFGVQLPLRKIDLVVIPDLTNISSVDNWGLSVFDESNFYSAGRYGVTRALIHQWLGSWVSPHWCNDELLSEALTTFLIPSVVDMDLEFGEWYPGSYVYTMYYGFSELKPRLGVRDSLSSFKSQLVFRMFNYTLGGETFENGLRKFMDQRQFSTFTDDDVWDALTKEAHSDKTLSEKLTINEIAASWITKDRLPVLTFERNYDEGTATISQKVFIRNPNHDVPEQDKMLWWIPLVIINEDTLDFTSSIPRTWMKETKEITLSDMPEEDKFIIVNPEEIGPFPVNYDERNWNLLAQYLQTEDGKANIPDFTRAKLLHDAWNLAYAGDLNFATALNMTLFLKSEESHKVWDVFFTFIDHVGRRIDMSPIFKKFKTYARFLIYDLDKDLGDYVEGEDVSKTKLRSAANVWGCLADCCSEIKKDQEALKRWMKSKNPDNENPIAKYRMCSVIGRSTYEEWEFLLKRMINFPPSGVASERSEFIRALSGCPDQSERPERFLNIIVLGESGNFTDDDISLAFTMMTGGSSGYTALFNFLSKNWYAIKQRFKDNTYLWDKLVRLATGMFATQEGYDKVSKLYNRRRGQFGSAKDIIEESLKTIKVEAKWSEENFAVIGNWLDNFFKTVNMSDYKFMCSAG